MKQIKRFFVMLLITALLSSAFTFSAYAGDGSGNMNGGGGDMGGGTAQNVWHNGDDGVRVTVVRAIDNQPVSTPFDMTNRDESDTKMYFVKKSKLSYRSGSVLVPDTDNKYEAIRPGKPLPTIITGNNTNNIPAIKAYFCSSETVKKIASIVGTSYDNLTSGNFKLLLEPIAYFTFNGVKLAMTATEAAKYDQLISGGLRSKMVSLSHQNLPLSMFLEHSDMGYPAYEGSQSRPQSDSVIINELGLGIVKFTEGDDGGSEPSGSNAEYRCNTDVITSVNLSAGSQIDPDSPASVTFHILGGTYTVTNVVIPEGESQLVWVKWHTPATPQTVSIKVSANKGSLDVGTISAKVVSLEGQEPPDPKATDRNDTFTVPDIPHNVEQLAASWGVWNAVWIPNWVWEEDWTWIDHPEWESGGEWVDNGRWVDEGEWQYSFTSYHASLTASMTLSPDDKVPTASGKTMRSGYGVKISIEGTVRSSAPTSQYTVGQTAISYFPEFSYKSYWRLLDLTKDGDAFSFAFKPNIYSTYNRRVHFTPVWYPDGEYPVFTFLEDAWTPAGQLKADLSDYVTIDGSVYDDWHIGPKLVD